MLKLTAWSLVNTSRSIDDTCPLLTDDSSREQELGNA
jgi:hypothetical protein